MHGNAGQYYFQSSDGEPFTVVNAADGPVEEEILSRVASASPPNSITGLAPNQVP